MSQINLKREDMRPVLNNVWNSPLKYCTLWTLNKNTPKPSNIQWNSLSSHLGSLIFDKVYKWLKSFLWKGLIPIEQRQIDLNSYLHKEKKPFDQAEVFWNAQSEFLLIITHSQPVFEHLEENPPRFKFMVWKKVDNKCLWLVNRYF